MKTTPEQRIVDIKEFHAAWDELRISWNEILAEIHVALEPFLRRCRSLFGP